jgi:hypothetical protein
MTTYVSYLTERTTPHYLLWGPHSDFSKCGSYFCRTLYMTHFHHICNITMLLSQNTVIWQSPSYSVSKHPDFSSNWQQNSKEIYTFYKVIQKQICNTHMFIHNVVVFPKATRSAVFILSHTSATQQMVVECIITLQYISLFCYIT